MREGISHTLAGEEQARYLTQLDNQFATLEALLPLERNAQQEAALAEFGKKEGWDPTRLPKLDSTYSTLAELIRRVKEEYQWFQWRCSPDQPERNCGFFDSINVSQESGLPWVFNFIELSRLKDHVNDKLSQVESYEEAAREFEQLFMGDETPVPEVKAQAQTLQRGALRRNFLEQLTQAKLIGCELSQPGLFSAKKVLPLGGEVLWNVSCVKYIPGASMFEIYVVDAWQDIRGQPEIVEGKDKSSGVVSEKLKKAFQHFSIDNAPWYVLRSIDERFEVLHPVHVSRALIGPFENKYRTHTSSIRSLPVMEELLKEDPHASCLRFSRQYSLAPKHTTKGDQIRQVIYRDGWSDEIIVAPAQYAARVANSVLGSQVRIFEARKVAA